MNVMMTRRATITNDYGDYEGGDAEEDGDSHSGENGEVRLIVETTTIMVAVFGSP